VRKFCHSREETASYLIKCEGIIGAGGKGSQGREGVAW
jgi:hypothetical protein